MLNAEFSALIINCRFFLVLEEVKETSGNTKVVHLQGFIRHTFSQYSLKTIELSRDNSFL